MSSTMKFTKAIPTALGLVRGSEKAAGYDIYSAEDVELAPNSVTKVSSGICIAIPPGHCGQVWARSSMAMKGISVGAGIIDEDYRGIVSVILVNNNETSFKVKTNDRVAQMLFVPYLAVRLEHVESLEETVRGTGGFGSTGLNFEDLKI